jgi:hypothetical protein
VVLNAELFTQSLSSQLLTSLFHKWREKDESNLRLDEWSPGIVQAPLSQDISVPVSSKSLSPGHHLRILRQDFKAPNLQCLLYQQNDGLPPPVFRFNAVKLADASLA